MMDRIGIGVCLIAYGIGGAIQGWPHMGIPIGLGTELLIGAALWGRR